VRRRSFGAKYRSVWGQDDDEQYAQENDMLYECPDGFLIFWPQSIADEGRGSARETITEDYEEEKNRKCLTHGSRRFDTELPCPVCIGDIEKCVKKESDSRRKSDFPEERRRFYRRGDLVET
jgi:hypothetical protein